MKIDEIVLFAAGRGTRMEHLTADMPKSLLQVFGKPILYHALDLCKTYPFKKVIINTHYLAEKITTALAEYQRINPDFPKIITAYEENLLETGGTIKNLRRLNIISDKPLFTLNADVILQTSDTFDPSKFRRKTSGKHVQVPKFDAPNNVFLQMLDYWQPDKMNFLLLLQDFKQAIGYTGNGDFQLESDGRVTRPPKAANMPENYDYMYTGLGILQPEVIAADTRQVFSLKDYYFQDKKVFGLRAKELKWYHATCPKDIDTIDANLG